MKKWIAALLLALLGGIAAIAVLLYRGTELGPATAFAERQLGALLSRPINLGDAPQIRIRKTLRVELSGAEIANAPWAADTPLLTARRISAELDTRSLLRGPVLIHAIRAEGLVLALERSADGESNLPVPGADPAGDDTPWDTLPVILETAALADVTISRTNHENGQRATLQVEELNHGSTAGDGLLIEGAGTFQDWPWTLRATATDLQSIARSAPFAIDVDARLPRLRVSGNAMAPRLDTLSDLSLDLQAEGELPPSIAELTPLLKPDAPVSVQLRAADIDPGVELNAAIQLPNLQLQAWGEVREPLEIDGIALEFTAESPSSLAITRALSLGDTEDNAVLLQGNIRRDGALVSARELKLRVGAHGVDADVYLPDFPRSDGGRIDIRGQGPDFSLYQRLFERPVSFPLPYEFSGSLQPDKVGVEIVNSSLRIGDHALAIGGPIGDFPSYRDSDIRFEAEGPDVDAISEALGLSLPHFRYRASGNLRVDDGGNIVIPGIDLEISPLRLNVDGRLGGYPEFGNIDLNLRAATDSLAALARQFEQERLPGDVAAEASLHLGGDPDDLRATAIRVAAGDVLITTREGGLNYAGGTIRSDIEVRVEAANLAELLGDYAHERIPSGTLGGTFRPRLDEDVIDISLADFDGPAARGNAHLRIGRDFQVDERTLVSVDLQIDKPGSLLPDTAGYAPPQSPIQLAASTTRRGADTVVEAQIEASEETRLNLRAVLPRGGGPQRLEISGSGADLHALGAHSALPSVPMPFRIDAELVRDDDAVAVDIRDFDIAGTRIQGTGSLERDTRQLQADLQIPVGALDIWLENDARAEDEEETTAADEDNYLIPDRPLRVEWLDGYTTDLRLEAGPLGITDRLAPSKSLVDRVEISFRSGGGSAVLELAELSGSRGNLQAHVDVRREGDGAHIESTFHLRDLPGGLRMSEGDTENLPKYTIDAQLSASGASTRELAATLTGPFLLSGGPGTLRDVNLGFATESFVDQLLKTLLPAVEKDTDLQVVCTVLGARAENGLVQLNPGFVLRSKSVDLTARGSINLANEKIRIRFDNQARKGLGISAAGLVNPYVQITGTLGSPALALDVASGAIAGGAAAATGGLSVVATTFYGRFLRRNPCKTALERWEEHSE